MERKHGKLVLTRAGLIWDLLNKPAVRWRRFITDVVLDAFVVLIAYFSARALIAPAAMQWPFTLQVWGQVVLLSLLFTGILFCKRIYSVSVRYFGLDDFLSIAMAGGIVGAALLLVPMTLNGVSTQAHHMLMPVLFALLSITFASSLRVIQRLKSWRKSNSNENRIRNTLIVGAGDAGETIVRELTRMNKSVHQVRAFVDDDANKIGMRIHGVPVLGCIEDIPELVVDLHIEDILIALPSAQGKDMRRITNICHKTNARVRTLPAVNSILRTGSHLMTTLRDIDIEDLLRREPVQTDMQRIGEYINGARVLITGGGGSIGSELARQIAKMSPANLILVGKGENSIYEIEQELQQTLHVFPTCVIADVRDRASMERVFEKYRPTVVFHAAAHKHVPLMQGNPIEAIKNNVLGTWTVADLAIKYGASRFIYISTDKAVMPKSIMGATKRVGEMIVASLSKRAETEFAIVRFGNVLGSRGSLIPMLKAQIKRGGPVRITTPEMTRYFMTIPEAAQLVLQAGSMGAEGEIFILDMGQPVKIIDLAYDLIRLHGLKPGEDIEIQFIGERPGEKIHEVLLRDEEVQTPTSHKSITTAGKPSEIEWDWLKNEVELLFSFCEDGKAAEAHSHLMELAWGKTDKSIAVPTALRESD